MTIALLLKSLLCFSQLIKQWDQLINLLNFCEARDLSGSKQWKINRHLLAGHFSDNE